MKARKNAYATTPPDNNRLKLSKPKLVAAGIGAVKSNTPTSKWVICSLSEPGKSLGEEE
jgi:hypothetical protein